LKFQLQNQRASAPGQIGSEID